MIYVAYCSAANELMGSAELVSLLQHCRINNARDGITGMLLYRDGSFMQVLEGEEAAVNRTYSRILADPRHRNIIRLAQGKLTERNFTGWTMGFHDLTALTPDDLDSFSSFLIEPLEADTYKQPGKAMKLLKAFREITS